MSDPLVTKYFLDYSTLLHTDLSNYPMLEAKTWAALEQDRITLNKIYPELKHVRIERAAGGRPKGGKGGRGRRVRVQAGSKTLRQQILDLLKTPPRSTTSGVPTPV